MHTSPDDDARLLPWIDAVGSRDGIHTRFLLVDGKGVLAGEPSEMLEAQKYYEWSNTLLDGGIVDTSSCFDDAARRACASQAPAADWRKGYARLMSCIMHSDDERCELCGNDPS